VTVKITNFQHDEENLHDGPACSQVHDCLEACFEKFPYDVCWVQREQFSCEKVEKGVSGKCVVTHFMKNNSIFEDVKIDHAALLQSDAIQSEALQGEAKSKILITEEDHKLFEESCDDCVCWGESASRCTEQLVTDGMRCGWSIVENVQYYYNGMVTYGCSWLGCEPTITIERTPLQCSSWGPCHWPVSFNGCIARIGDFAGDKVGKFMECAT